MFSTVKKQMKTFLKKIIYLIVVFPYFLAHGVISFFALFHNAFRVVELEYKNRFLNTLVKQVNHHVINGEDIKISLYTPNSLCEYRANTFSTKEPETLGWIEEFGDNDTILFDIGANIGIYSIYHSLVNKGKVIAFEPSFFNLKLLVKNININSVQNSIVVVTNPLSSTNGVNNFKYGNEVEGGALSAFGVDFGYDGKSINSELSVNVIGQSLDSLLENNLIEENTAYFIKIDVDGIEHLILSGSINTLSNRNCKSVLVEVNDSFSQQSAEVRSILERCGFILRNKTHATMFDDDSHNHSSTYNQIWVREN